jgi:hypothetical protein
MRTVLVVAAVAVIAGGVLFGLRWGGLLSHDAMVIGFATGFAVAVVMAIANKRRS